MIKFKVDFKEIHKSIGDLHKKIDRPKDMLREIGDVVTEDIIQRIVKTKKDLDEIPWSPWKPSTAKARQKEGTASKGLLFRKGNLARSIKSQVTGKHTLSVFTTVGYAQYLHEGTPNMASRKFMGISKRAQKGIDQVLMKHFEGSRK